MQLNDIPLPPDFVPPPQQQQASVPVVTGAPPVPSNVPQPAQPSMLDRLREQVMQDIMPNPGLDWQRSLRAFVAGMGDTQGKSLGAGLSAGMRGVAAQEQSDQQARANRLKSAEESDYRQAQIRLEEAKQRFEQDPTNWKARADLMRAEAAMRQADAAMARNSIERQPRWNIVPGENGQPVFVNMNDPTQRMPGTGLALPRDPQMEAAARTRATAAAEAAVKQLTDTGQLDARNTAAVQRAWQEAYDRALAGIQRPSPGAAPGPVGGSDVTPPRTTQRFQYQPPQ